MKQEQAQKQKQAQARPEQEHENQAVPVLSNAELDQATSDVLNEIDEVLEENAEEFVQGYIQKGGQ